MGRLDEQWCLEWLKVSVVQLTLLDARGDLEGQTVPGAQKNPNLTVQLSQI